MREHLLQGLYGVDSLDSVNVQLQSQTDGYQQLMCHDGQSRWLQ